MEGYRYHGNPDLLIIISFPSGLTPMESSRWQTLVFLKTSTQRTTFNRAKRIQGAAAHQVDGT